ncbi:MAG: right-handed parallel beta-helix repeat-containing protein [Clostridia bacterium]|nr:right-handed parallel beta-helix repeat-containing protein [Clostridia bacterium]
MNKKKITLMAIAICLIAILSMSTLAWFTDKDEVTNNFYIANSEDDPDEIFSVDVWEDDEKDDTNDTDADKIQDGITYDDILPGDTRYKEVHVENTGYYDQYIRATVTVSGASVWQDVYGMHVVPLDEFADITGQNRALIAKTVSYYDAQNDTFVYELYYADAIAADDEIIVFENIKIDERLDRFQAAELSGEFYINVVADAIQTANLPTDVFEAFNTVGLVKAAPISDPAALAAALASEDEAYLIIDAAALTNNTLAIDAPIKNKTLDFNGQDAVVTFGATATAENVVVSGIVDTDGIGYSVVTDAAFTGDVAIVGCTLKNTNGIGCISPAGGNVTIDNCDLEGTGKTYGVRANGKVGDLTITNTAFKNFGSWAILINGTQDGDLTVDNCTFETPDGVLKTLGGGVVGDFTFTNNTMIGVKGHDGNPSKILVSGSGTGPVIASGTKTVTGNTLDGAAWTQA